MDNLISSTKAASGKIGLKTAAIFVAGFVVFLILLFAWDLLMSPSPAAQDAGATVDVSSIDPKLEGELRKAIDFEGFNVPSDVKNPFSDNAGLAEAANAAGATTPGTTPGAQPGTTPGASGTKPGETKAPDPVAETKERYEERQRKLRMGLAVGPESEVFAIDDLMPVGAVSGGSGRQEVMFFSRALNRTVSFPLGARVFDGWIAEVRSQGVMFVIDGKVKSSRIKLWESSIKQSLNIVPNLENVRTDSAAVFNGLDFLRVREAEARA